MSEEVRVTSSTGAEKGSKLAKHSLIPPGPLNALAEHYGLGAEKYEKHNWRKGYDWSLSFDALMRHANAFWGGEDVDPELGSPHMAAVAFHAFTLLSFMAEHPEFDDRYKPENKDEVDHEEVQRLWAELQDRARKDMSHLLETRRVDTPYIGNVERVAKEVFESGVTPHFTVMPNGDQIKHFNDAQDTSEETARIVKGAILHETKNKNKECKCWK